MSRLTRLLVIAAIAVWSYFTNLLTPVIFGLVFVIECLVRVRVLPDHAHHSVIFQPSPAWSGYRLATG